MTLTLPLALLLAQAGGAVTGGAAPPIVGAPLPIPRSAPRPTTPATAGGNPTRFGECVEAAKENPVAAIEAAEEWLKVSKGTATIEPNHCLGIAYNLLGRPVEAELAFTFARDAVPASNRGLRALLRRHTIYYNRRLQCQFNLFLFSVEQEHIILIDRHFRSISNVDIDVCRCFRLIPFCDLPRRLNRHYFLLLFRYSR